MWETKENPDFISEQTEYEVLYSDETTEKATPQYRSFDLDGEKLKPIKPTFVFWLVEQEKEVVGWRIKK